MLNRLQDSTFRNLVIHDAIDRFLRLFELLGEVPTDGFTLPVRVRGEVDGIHLLRRFCQCLDNLPLAADEDIFGGEGVLNIDTELLFRQIADMSDRGFNEVIPTQNLFDGFRFRRRFHNDE